MADWMQLYPHECTNSHYQPFLSGATKCPIMGWSQKRKEKSGYWVSHGA